MINKENASTCMYESLSQCFECFNEFEPVKPWQKFCCPECHDKFHNRRRKQKTPTAGTVSAERRSNLTAAYHSKTIRPNTKLASVLAHLARGNSLNRFQAELVCHDHCLNTTVCEIERHGIDVSRKDEVIPGYQGRPTHCKRYWLTDEAKAKAAQLLGWQTWQEPASR